MNEHKENKCECQCQGCQDIHAPKFYFTEKDYREIELMLNKFKRKNIDSAIIINFILGLMEKAAKKERRNQS